MCVHQSVLRLSIVEVLTGIISKHVNEGRSCQVFRGVLQAVTLSITMGRVTRQKVLQSVFIHAYVLHLIKGKVEAGERALRPLPRGHPCCDHVLPRRETTQSPPDRPSDTDVHLVLKLIYRDRMITMDAITTVDRNMITVGPRLLSSVNR